MRIRKQIVVRPADLGRTDLVVFPDLPDEVGEGLVYIDALLCRGLDELAAEVLRKVAALWERGKPDVSRVSESTGK
jgi:hypothetical protein